MVELPLDTNYGLAVHYAFGGDPDDMVRSLKSVLKQEADKRWKDGSLVLPSRFYRGSGLWDEAGKKVAIAQNTAELLSLRREFGIQDPIGSDTTLGRVLDIYQEVGLNKSIMLAEMEVEKRRLTGQVENLFHDFYPIENIILASCLTPNSLQNMINGHISLVRKGREPYVRGLCSDLEGLLQPGFPFPDHINTLLKENSLGRM